VNTSTTSRSTVAISIMSANNSLGGQGQGYGLG
jgi:hypothetical protein